MRESISSGFFHIVMFYLVNNKSSLNNSKVATDPVISVGSWDHSWQATSNLASSQPTVGGLRAEGGG